MTRGLHRFQESGQSHFVTFSCYHRQPNFATPELCDLFVLCLENTRRHFDLQVYGYVVMPEHVHLLLSEPAKAKLADAIHDLKLSFSKQAKSLSVEGAPGFAPVRWARTWVFLAGPLLRPQCPRLR